ncbi:MAG TPA: type II secretion system F family protein [Sulfuricurvum sp.]|nr:type II secretion system F family protein [Sulfuricurvum sp.]
MTLLIFLAFFALMSAIGAFGYYAYDTYSRDRWLREIFETKDPKILEDQSSNFEKTLRLKLTRAGITQKQFIEVAVAGAIGALALVALIFMMDMSLFMNVVLGMAALAMALGTAPLYLEEQISARIKRIEEDLSIFIDLLIIILEGGGGLNNAIDQVTRDGASVIRRDLLEESKLFKNEYVTYSSEIAYENLIRRTGSDAIATIVNFMRLSEETGIGVKTVFENQSREIKEQEMLQIEKKAAMMNINLTLIMFLFILPAMIAMIAFPISADSLMSGL